MPAAAGRNDAVKIHFVTGKGGVGKSCLAASLALKLANSGKRTLLVELGDNSYFEHFLSITSNNMRSQNSVTYQPSLLRQNLWVSLWSGEECLREYAKYLLKIDGLYRLLFENPVSRALIQIAPSLKELSIMGKVTSGPPRHVGPRLPFDVLVIDAYSTGHFVALIQAAKGMSKAFRMGPMAEQSLAIQAVLKNPEICDYHVVSIPEELPVIEGLELSKKIKEITGISPNHILNKWIHLPDLGGTHLSQKIQAPQIFPSYLSKLDLRQKGAFQIYEQQLGSLAVKVRKIPYIFQNNPWTVVEKLAGEDLYR